MENYHDFTRQINAIGTSPRKQYTMEEAKEFFNLFHGVLLAQNMVPIALICLVEVMVVLHTAANSEGLALNVLARP